MIYLLIIIIIVGCLLTIFYLNAYSKLSMIKTKMDYAQDNITNLLKEKLKAMKKISEIVKKHIKKKDYLKEFNNLKTNNLTNYELDSELNKYLIIMQNLKDDYKSLNNDEYNSLLNEIKIINQNIMANKKFFNKNNNELIKVLKGYNKIVAKINHIYIRTSYELK